MLSTRCKVLPALNEGQYRIFTRPVWTYIPRCLFCEPRLVDAILLPRVLERRGDKHCDHRAQGLGREGQEAAGAGTGAGT